MPVTDRAPGPIPIRVARNVGWLAAGETVVKLGLFLVAALVGRRWGRAGLGIFTVSSGAAQIAVTVLALGQVDLLIRETARAPRAARGLLGGARRIQGRLLFALLPILAAGLWLVEDRALRWALLAFLPFSVLRTDFMTRGAIFKGLDRMDVEVKARTLELAVSLTLVYLLTRLPLPVWVVGGALAIGTGCGLVSLARRTRRLPVPAEPVAAELPREGWPFLALAILFQVLLRSDTLLMALLAIPKAEIGLYASAVIPTLGLLALPQLLAFSVYPTFSRSTPGDRGAMGAIAAATGLGLSSGALAGAALWAFREKLLVLFFGAGFAAAADLLARLAWALPGASAAMLLAALLAGWRRQKWSLAVKVAAVCASLLMNAWWIPRGGVAAAANVAVAVHTGEATLLLLLACACVAAGRKRGEPPAARGLW